jgi:ATP-dependent DNA ligase
LAAAGPRALTPSAETQRALSFAANPVLDRVMDADQLISPMLAKAVPTIPDADSVIGGLAYEPKWDGFRAIVYAGEEVEIGSRGSKMLTRYFPELVREFLTQLPVSCVLDGEIVVRTGVAGAERLDWEALSQRIHPAESRIQKLAVETPASFIAFDLLSLDGVSLLNQPFGERRAALEALLRSATAPLHLTQVSRDVELARRWLVEFEGAGLDGVVSKPLAAAYAPGKRLMLKTKHARTADVVLLGYRVHTSGHGVGSLLVGLYDAEGELRNVGGASAFTDARRLALIDELAPLVVKDEAGKMVRGATDRSRFSANKDTSFVRLEPTRVLEVRYDQMEGSRFRHSVQFDRWRPDRDPLSCTFEQLERPIAYDLAQVVS